MRSPPKPRKPFKPGEFVFRIKCTTTPHRLLPFPFFSARGNERDRASAPGRQIMESTIEINNSTFAGSVFDERRLNETYHLSPQPHSTSVRDSGGTRTKRPERNTKRARAPVLGGSALRREFHFGMLSEFLRVNLSLPVLPAVAVYHKNLFFLCCIC